MSASRYLTSEETAELLRCSVRSVQALVSERRIPHRRIGGVRRTLFSPDEIARWLDGAPLETIETPDGGRVVRIAGGES